MATTTKITCKVCRREGVSVCGKETCAFKKRPYPPGIHGPKAMRKRPRLSSYGLQLREKQKAKRLYNIQEKQFRNYFAEASKRMGNTAENLLELLERRLDNTVYRMGLAKTRRQARQFVGHGFVEVNGRKVDIPSFRVSVGDIVTVKESKQDSSLVKSIKETIGKNETPKWLAFDAKAMKGTVTSMPDVEDMEKIFDTTLIVEFYSR